MTAYVDASVVLRLVLTQARALREWSLLDKAASSVLIRVETLRTLDRLRVLGKLSDLQLSAGRQSLLTVLASLELIELSSDVLERAAQPLPTTLGTLDSIHLATALLWRASQTEEAVIATHDRQLAIAAKAHGMRVIGVQL